MESLFLHEADNMQGNKLTQQIIMDGGTKYCEGN